MIFHFTIFHLNSPWSSIFWFNSSQSSLVTDLVSSVDSDSLASWHTWWHSQFSVSNNPLEAGGHVWQGRSPPGRVCLLLAEGAQRHRPAISPHLLQPQGHRALSPLPREGPDWAPPEAGWWEASWVTTSHWVGGTMGRFAVPHGPRLPAGRAAGKTRQTWRKKPAAPHTWAQHEQPRHAGHA